MAKTFLRSGNLDAVLALGENGQPVYASALQIRETLRLRRQNALADCLAIPQANERGDRLDWYAPFSGKVKSWLGASDHERRQALEQLTACQQDMNALSARACEADNPAMRFFGALLSKSLQFPDQQYVYLVDGKPVITFWGFVDAQARSRDDALSCLRDSIEESLPKVLVDTAPPVAPVVKTESEPEPEPVAAIRAADPVIAEPVVAEQPAEKRRSGFRVWYLLPPVAIAAAVAVAVVLHTSKPEALPVKPVAAAPVKTPAIVLSSQKLAETLPQKPATVVEAAVPPVTAPSATLESVVVPAMPTEPQELVIATHSVRNGTVNMLDGRWRVTLQTRLPTGKPPSLLFEFKAGKGSAQISQGDNIRCTADVTAAMTAAGNLVMRSRYTAKCSDGSRYRMPLLVCKASDGPAVCEARYGKDQVFPMTIKRESK